MNGEPQPSSPFRHKLIIRSLWCWWVFTWFYLCFTCGCHNLLRCDQSAVCLGWAVCGRWIVCDGEALSFDVDVCSCLPGLADLVYKASGLASMSPQPDHLPDKRQLSKHKKLAWRLPPQQCRVPQSIQPPHRCITQHSMRRVWCRGRGQRGVLLLLLRRHQPRPAERPLVACILQLQQQRHLCTAMGTRHRQPCTDLRTVIMPLCQQRSCHQSTPCRRDIHYSPIYNQLCPQTWWCQRSLTRTQLSRPEQPTSTWPRYQPAPARDTLASCHRGALTVYERLSLFSTLFCRKNWLVWRRCVTLSWVTLTSCTGSRRGVWSSSGTPVSAPTSLTQSTRRPSTRTTTSSASVWSSASVTASSSSRSPTTSPPSSRPRRQRPARNTPRSSPRSPPHQTAGAAPRRSARAAMARPHASSSPHQHRTLAPQTRAVTMTPLWTVPAVPSRTLYPLVTVSPLVTTTARRGSRWTRWLYRSCRTGTRSTLITRIPLTSRRQRWLNRETSDPRKSRSGWPTSACDHWTLCPSTARSTRSVCSGYVSSSCPSPSPWILCICKERHLSEEPASRTSP